jgi:hypothetical protein
VSKEDLMRAGASCLRPSLPLQKGLQKLFEEEYDAIFGKQTTRRLLSQHSLFRECARLARGSSSRKYGKFIVCHLVWEEISADLRSNLRHEHFVSICNGQSPDSLKLEATIETASKAVDAYYTAERGTGANLVAASTFFKRRDVHTGLEGWLATKGAAHAARFAQEAGHLREALTA